MKDAVVHLLGLAGTGKLTIARALCNSMDAALIDSHLINNPVFRAIKADGATPVPDPAWAHIHVIRRAVLEAIATCAPPGENYIFTNAPHAGNAHDEAELRDMRAAFARMGKTYIPVRLTCTEDELVRRRTAPGRREALKDTSADRARHEARTHEVARTGDANEMTLDVTHLSPEQAARKILDHVELVISRKAA